MRNTDFVLKSEVKIRAYHNRGGKSPIRGVAGETPRGVLTFRLVQVLTGYDYFRKSGGSCFEFGGTWDVRSIGPVCPA